MKIKVRCAACGATQDFDDLDFFKCGACNYEYYTKIQYPDLDVTQIVDQARDIYNEGLKCISRKNRLVQMANRQFDVVKDNLRILGIDYTYARLYFLVDPPRFMPYEKWCRAQIEIVFENEVPESQWRSIKEQLRERLIDSINMKASIHPHCMFVVVDLNDKTWE